MTVYEGSIDKSYVSYRRSSYGGDWTSTGSYDSLDYRRVTSKQSLKEAIRTKGYIPPLPYVSWKNTSDITPIAVTTTLRSPRYSPGWSTYQFLVPLGLNEVTAYGRLGSKAAGEMRRLTSSALGELYQRASDQRVGLGEVCAELPKTVEMFATTASRIVSAYRDVRKGRFAKAARQLGCAVPSFRGWKKADLKRSADVWLEYRYGWTPLYSDLFGSLTLAYDMIRRRPNPVHHVYGQESSRNRFVRSGIAMPDADPARVPYYTDSIEQELRVRYDAWFTLENKTVALAANLGVANPLLLAWELLPLSFVVDWFTNVGDCLNALSAFSGKSVLSVSETKFSNVKFDRVVTRVGTNLDLSSSSITYVGGNGSRSEMSMERKVLSSVPALVPRVQVDFNPKRLTDALALLAQTFNR